MRKDACGFIALSMLLLASAAIALECPETPKQISKDVDAKVRAEVGRIGPLRGAELETSVKTTTKDLLGSLKGADKIYIEQMMFAAYCSGIRDDAKLSGSEKAKQILVYRKLLQESLKSLGAPQQKPVSQTKSHTVSAAVLSVKYNRRFSNHPHFWVAHLDNGETLVVDSDSDKVLRKAKCSGTTGQGAAVVSGPRGDSNAPNYFIAVWCNFKVNMYSLSRPSEDFVLNPSINLSSASGWTGEFTLASGLNDFVSSGIGPCVHQWDLKTKAAEQKVQCDQRIDVVALYENAPLLLTATHSGAVSFWELIGQPKLRWEAKLEKVENNYGAAVSKLGASEKGRYIFAVSNGPKTYLLDMVDGAARGVSHQPKATVMDAVLDKPGELLATGASDGKIIVWLTKDASKVWTFEHDEMVSKLAFSSDSRFLVSTSDDKSIRVWSLETGKETSRVDSERACSALAVQPKSDGDYVLVGTGRRFRTQNAKTGAFFVREWRLSASGKLVSQRGT